MSTRVGTLKPSKGRSIWPIAVVVSVVMLTVAVIALSRDRGEPAPATTTSKVDAQPVEAPAVGVASGIAGTAANTPSELRDLATAKRIGAAISFVRHVPQPGSGAGADQTEASGTEWPRTADALAAAERDRHQRI